MLKESEISGYSPRRSHRTYTPQFKCELVAACQQPGVSIAALAGQHGMNANVLHRWLQEHQRDGCHRLVSQHLPNSPALGAFVPVQLSGAPPVAKEQAISIEVRKGALTMLITWPVCAVTDLASWTTAVVK
jgi:transposase